MFYDENKYNYFDQNKRHVNYYYKITNRYVLLTLTLRDTVNWVMVRTNDNLFVKLLWFHILPYYIT